MHFALRRTLFSLIYLCIFKQKYCRKIAGRNINNLRYADDTTLMAESEKELKNLLKKIKEYIVMVFIFLAYFTLYNGLQFHPSH